MAALRSVIDVSGDGCQNTGEVATADARDAAVSHGFTVNGLPITSGHNSGVEDWYRANVVGGPGAFLVVADSYDAFAAAFRHKLTLEISGLRTGLQLAHASGNPQWPDWRVPVGADREHKKAGRKGLPEILIVSGPLRPLPFEHPNGLGTLCRP